MAIEDQFNLYFLGTLPLIGLAIFLIAKPKPIAIIKYIRRAWLSVILAAIYLATAIRTCLELQVPAWQVDGVITAKLQIFLFLVAPLFIGWRLHKGTEDPFETYEV